MLKKSYLERSVLKGSKNETKKLLKYFITNTVSTETLLKNASFIFDEIQSLQVSLEFF